MWNIWSFRTGKTVCEGYARLYRHFANNINLIVENITGFAKGFGYNPTKLNEKLDANHAYNAVKLKNKWYLIDSTWGAGYILKDHFVKEYEPFYFCIKPEFIINTHYPLNENWQLLERPIKFEQFKSNIKLNKNFLTIVFMK